PRDIARIGVAVQGLAENQRGIVTWSPAFGSHDIPIAHPLTQAFGIPVAIGNDANMIAEALIGNGAPRHGTNIVIFIGHGVGMGLIIDGAVFHGDTGAAAEFGHMNHLPRGALCRCGRRGCIEAYAADYGILRMANGGASNEPPHATAIPDQVLRNIETAARAGNPHASAAFAAAGEALGYGIARLIAVLNPSRIVIAGIGTRAMPLLAPSLHQAIADGVVEELRRGILIDIIPLETDLIIQGTIAQALRTLDRDVFAPGVMETGR
ncbi:MAG: ROK family protein, partial [Vibrio fluvialis]